MSKFRGKSCKVPDITAAQWVEFYANNAKQYVSNNYLYYGILDPLLDREFTMLNLTEALHSSKLNKSPGEDAVTNEFFKALPYNWKLYLLCLFNKVLKEEVVPDNWASIIVTMLYKKGDKDDLSNYRPIALVNHVTKLFTSMLANRLYTWAYNCNILPEGQAGFRSHRSCLDNLFVLMETIHSILRQDKGNAFDIFVDFKRAFDSIAHDKLWNKLLKLGVSATLIRILKNLYDKATIRVKAKDGLSEKIEINEGVLQGKILSALLFILYISDMEDFFRSKGLYDISINPSIDVLLLLYANDLAILARSRANVAAKLKVLQEYCEINQLIVNETKTEVLYCRKAGRIPSNLNFLYNGNNIKVVSSYTYLRIPFSSSGRGRLALTNATKKARSAIGAIISLIYRSKIKNFDIITSLFEGMVASVALYAAPIWALRYTSELDCLLTEFFKSILSLKRTTSNALVKKETNKLSLSYMIWKQTWNWLVNILNMDENRLPYQCLIKQIKLYKNNYKNVKYNWFAQIGNFINTVDAKFLYLIDT